MEHVTCPVCLRPAKRMPILSFVVRDDDFYLCEACGEVSFMPKDASAPPQPFHQRQPAYAAVRRSGS